VDRPGARFGLRASYTILAANPASNADLDHHPHLNSDAGPHIYADADLYANSDPDGNPNTNANANSLAEGRFHP
jgi:hypothetical protein